jgi:predicted nucleic acid-binding protein
LKRFFDSSVLIPAFYKFDSHHDASAEAVRSASRNDCFCALRTLGEVYAVLTGLPLRPRISGADGMAVLQQIREKLTIVSLSELEYVSAIESVSETIVGGAAYDALIAGCAIKAQADVLLTWNTRDFTRFGPGIARLVKTPTELRTQTSG